MGVKGKPDIIDIIEKKRLQWCGDVKRMPEARIPKLIMEWLPLERRKRGRPRKMWMEGVQAAMTKRNLEPDQWRNRNGVCFPEEGDSCYKTGWMDGWIICSTCFGHLYAHPQELETILVLLTHLVCNSTFTNFHKL